MFYLLLANELSAFCKVQRLQFTGEVHKYINDWCDISSGFCIPKITKIYPFSTELFLKNSGCHHFFWNMVHMYSVHIKTHKVTDIVSDHSISNIDQQCIFCMHFNTISTFCDIFHHNIFHWLVNNLHHWVAGTVWLPYILAWVHENWNMCSDFL